MALIGHESQFNWVDRQPFSWIARAFRLSCFPLPFVVDAIIVIALIIYVDPKRYRRKGGVL